MDKTGRESCPVLNLRILLLQCHLLQLVKYSEWTKSNGPETLAAALRKELNRIFGLHPDKESSYECTE
jgi:hypothetical protein